MTAEPMELGRRAVRDLAWVIASPSILALGSEHHVGADDEWCRRNFMEYRGALDALDRDPAPLLAAIGDPSGMALGAYFEKLVEFWLASSGRYRIILRNQQVAAERRTIGEFDFILFDEREERYCHWEIAVKFYLGIGHTASPGAWYGPRKIDRLDLKSERMTGRQIELADTPAGAELLASHGIVIGERRIVMKGRLFYPASAVVLPPARANPTHLRGWWMEGEEFIGRYRRAPIRWTPLPKSRWLAPIIGEDDGLLDPEELLRVGGFDLPRCVAGILDGREVERGFIVPDGWAEHPA